MALRITALLLIAGALSACGSAHKASQSPVDSLRGALAETGLHLHALPPSALVGVSRRRAKETAARTGWPRPLATELTATLFRATDTAAYFTERPGGPHRLVVDHRPAWIVPIPDQARTTRGPAGITGGAGTKSFTYTSYVLVDANSGKVLEAVGVGTR